MIVEYKTGVENYFNIQKYSRDAVVESTVVPSSNRALPINIERLVKEGDIFELRYIIEKGESDAMCPLVFSSEDDSICLRIVIVHSPTLAQPDAYSIYRKENS